MKNIAHDSFITIEREIYIPIKKNRIKYLIDVRKN